MSEEWSAGDLALCISRHERYPAAVRPGAIFTVRAVIADMPDVLRDHRGTALKFDDVPDIGPRAAYCATRFRKITPTTPDDFDREVVRRLTGEPAT